MAKRKDSDLAAEKDGNDGLLKKKKRTYALPSVPPHSKVPFT